MFTQTIRLFLFLCTLTGAALAAQQEYQWGNVPSAPHSPGVILTLPGGVRLAPGAPLPEGYVRRGDGAIVTPRGVVISPSGVQTPDGTLPEGYVRREDGAVVTPDGVIISPDGTLPKGYTRKEDGSIVTPDGTVLNPDGALPEGYVRREDGAIVTPDGTVLLPATPPQEIPTAEREQPTPAPDQTRPETPQAIPTVPAAPEQAIQTPSPTPEPTPAPLQEKPSAQSETPRSRQLWELMPLSEIPERPSPEKPLAQAEKTEKKPGKKPEKKQEKKAEKPSKPKIGEELHIPPDAAKTGNLDFLEGCWQGTRPEYFSKRIIRECFCFGKNGGSGKRRILDGETRRCTGATAARLDGGGVLYVTSEGAACNDGARWGASQMTCRGQGKKTPCSWVFTDASGGRQAYEIPFVRVQSCGRK